MDAAASRTIDDIAAAMAAPRPVAVTRWTARLADPDHERAFRLQRFADDRRRLFIVMSLASATGALIFLGRLYALVMQGDPTEALYPPLVSAIMPLISMAIFYRMRTPEKLEITVLCVCTCGIMIRLMLLTLQPGTLAMWLPLMVTIIFIIYLYLPVRFVLAVVLASLFSIVAPVWWGLLAQTAVPGVEIYRGILWMLLANALGLTAANTLHRSQRSEFAQRIVLHKLLSTDAMTGIANRRRFDETLADEWRRCQRGGVPLSLLMIDVDHFKAYNDQCGHPQGDACLRQVARLLTAVVGPPGDLVARYGGEEFVCLLPEIGSAGALALATKIATALKDASIDHPRSPAGPRLTLSIGVATARQFSGVPENLVAFADKLLYAAKAAGRNQIKVGQLEPRPAIARAA
ncbi:MAG: GGDEF domain-containing protein [Proteobacteria bacterium]|nr:GGDEF domain-containing protein [Pseudomonadota bacterium]